MGIRLDYLETQKDAIEELEIKLKKSCQDELSQQLIEVSSKLSEYKLAELKAKRDITLLNQKEEYYQRLIRQYTESMKEMEEALSQWELKYAQREDFWRKRYNDQMKLIFAQSDESKPKTEKLDTTKGAAYLSDLKGKNDELQTLRNKCQEYEMLLKDKNARIELLEQNLTALEKGRREIPNYTPTANQTISIIRDAQTEEEAKKFAYAAQKTIQTLQDIIDDKNEQLERKDAIIKKLRDEYLAHKNQDAEEIKRLNEALAMAGKDTLDNFRMPQSRTLVESAMVGKISANEVEAIMLEKDRKIELLHRQIEATKREQEHEHRKLKEVKIYPIRFLFFSISLKLKN